MTVIDTSCVVDFLLRTGVWAQVQALMEEEGELSAPDLLVFEVLAVLRRYSLAGALPDSQAATALDALADVPVELFPALPLRARAWSLRANLTAADALFAALAEHLREPLATKDAALAEAARTHAEVAVLRF